jgi:RNA-directed DNA polymerase
MDYRHKQTTRGHDWTPIRGQSSTPIDIRACKLELHPGKTRIVYCKDINRTGDHPDIQFTFLGYTFRPRKALDKYGRIYVNFSPAVSREALKAMRQTIRGWHLQLKSDKTLADLSAMFAPILKGWQQYYGRFHGSALKSVWRNFSTPFP